jgi:hypothetical protein
MDKSKWKSKKIKASNKNSNKKRSPTSSLNLSQPQVLQVKGHGAYFHSFIIKRGTGCLMIK